MATLGAKLLTLCRIVNCFYVKKIPMWRGCHIGIVFCRVVFFGECLSSGFVGGFVTWFCWWFCHVGLSTVCLAVFVDGLSRGRRGHAPALRFGLHLCLRAGDRVLGRFLIVGRGLDFASQDFECCFVVGLVGYFVDEFAVDDAAVFVEYEHAACEEPCKWSVNEKQSVFLPEEG